MRNCPPCSYNCLYAIFPSWQLGKSVEDGQGKCFKRQLLSFCCCCFFSFSGQQLFACFSLSFDRFYCAGAADNRTRLDFHGERRIWDGRLIKQKIKGNSALYIYTDEVFLLQNEIA